MQVDIYETCSVDLELDASGKGIDLALIDYLIIWCTAPFQQYFSYIAAASAPIHALLESF